MHYENATACHLSVETCLASKAVIKGVVAYVLHRYFLKEKKVSWTEKHIFFFQVCKMSHLHRVAKKSLEEEGPGFTSSLIFVFLLCTRKLNLTKMYWPLVILRPPTPAAEIPPGIT